jgi:ABC-type oligopeptide transport system ATPase subunit
VKKGYALKRDLFVRRGRVDFSSGRGEDVGIVGESAAASRPRDTPPPLEKPTAGTVIVQRKGDLELVGTISERRAGMCILFQDPFCPRIRDGREGDHREP